VDTVNKTADQTPAKMDREVWQSPRFKVIDTRSAKGSSAGTGVDTFNYS
jgi:hypothetical protein